MALLLLASAWARGRGLDGDALAILTVDHGLRPESAAEAEQVGRWACALGHRAVVLRREGPAITRNVQAQARAARLSLMAAWCRRAGIGDLALAHNRDDQAETLLIRLARGSGVYGLAAMAPVAFHAETLDLCPIRLLRPLLDVPKARLLATLRAEGQPWIEDPSNADERFARARLRKLMPALAREGFTPARLAATATRMARARAALEAHVDAVLARAVRVDPAGFGRLDPALLRDAPEEIGLRALIAALRIVAPDAPHPPRLDRTERLYQAILTGGLDGGRTLAGCRVVPDQDEGVLVVREPAAIGSPILLGPGEQRLWDGRFMVSLEAGCPPGEVRALGPHGWALIRREVEDSQHIPHAARASLPAFWQGAELAAVPALGFHRAGFSHGAFRAQFPLPHPRPPP